MRMTLRQLEVFLSIARHSNTAVAARELHMSQSAASAALKALEDAYDIRLFDRVGKRLELNEIGKSMRSKAASLLAHARELDDELVGHDQIGHLKVGASFTIANHLAVTYIAAYLDHYPEANIELISANSPEIVHKVLNYEVDIGMIENEVKHPELELIPWSGDELVVFCSATHPLAQKARITDKDLREARWILREAESGARMRFERTFAKLLPELNIYLEFRHNEAIKRAVECGLGIGCLSQIVLQGNFNEQSLIPLALPKEYRMQRKFYFAQKKDAYRRPAVARWIQLCSEANGETLAQAPK